MVNVNDRMWRYIKRTHIAAISAVFGLSMAVSGTLALVPLTAAPVAAASACPQNNTPQYNIIYCGLSGSTDAEYISSLQGYYNNNNDGHGNSDIQTVLNWAGASPAMIAGMTTSNTVIGTAYSNGTITVNGAIVGNYSIVSARWNPGGPGFTHLEGNVWYRNATTSFAPTPQVQVLVHLNSSGQADFAVMIECGNVLKFTPTTTPKKVFTCDELTQSEVDSTLQYAFTASATAQNTAISSYTFYFGDGSQQTVNTSSSSTTSTDHTYNLNATTYNAKVVVNGSVTSSNCMVQLTTPPAPVKPTLTCVQLTPTLAPNSTTQYTFTAQASAQKTSIVSYTFDFGDNTITTIPSNAETINVSHTYTPGTYMASVTVNGENNLMATSPACTANLTISTTPPVTPPATTPPVLVNTGPGEVGGIFAAATTAGALFHHYLRRRFLSK